MRRIQNPCPQNPRTQTPCASRERGASEVFMLVLMPIMLAFAGLAYDAGMAFNARRDATNVAAAAARAGANEVSTDALYTINRPQLDRGDAVRTARNYVQANNLRPLSVRVDGIGESIYVQVEAVHQTTFLRIIGIGSLTVEAEARALAQNKAK